MASVLPEIKNTLSDCGGTHPYVTQHEDISVLPEIKNTLSDSGGTHASVTQHEDGQRVA